MPPGSAWNYSKLPSLATLQELLFQLFSIDFVCFLVVSAADGIFEGMLSHLEPLLVLLRSLALPPCWPMLAEFAVTARFRFSSVFPLFSQ